MSQAENTVKYIFKKWYIVVICALIGAGIMYMEKASIVPSVAVTGDQIYARLIRIDPVPVVKLGDTTVETDICNIAGTKIAWVSFLTTLEHNLDFEKISKGWKNLKQADKFNWLGRHIGVKHVGVGQYMLEISFTSTDAKDAVYVDEQSTQMMNILADTIEKEASGVTGGAKFITMENYNLSDTHEEVTQGELQKKYIIIGFVLGALAAVAVLAVFSLRRKEE